MEGSSETRLGLGGLKGQNKFLFWRTLALFTTRIESSRQDLITLRANSFDKSNYFCQLLFNLCIL